MTCRAHFCGIEHEKSYKQNVNRNHHVVIREENGCFGLESPDAARTLHGLISLGNGSILVRAVQHGDTEQQQPTRTS
jgi:hypothetical protein